MSEPGQGSDRLTELNTRLGGVGGAPNLRGRRPAGTYPAVTSTPDPVPMLVPDSLRTPAEGLPAVADRMVWAFGTPLARVPGFRWWRLPSAVVRVGAAMTVGSWRSAVLGGRTSLPRRLYDRPPARTT
jgi:hypothetical protein